MEKEAKKILGRLKRSYGIAPNLRVGIEICPAPLVMFGKAVHGHVHKPAGSGEVTIRISSDRKGSLLAMTIAHEYRHIMQWSCPDMEWFKLRSGKTDPETDANIFGNRFALEMLKS